MDRDVGKPRKRTVYIIYMYLIAIAAATVDVKSDTVMRDIKTGFQIGTDTTGTQRGFVHHGILFIAISIHM